MMNTTKIILGIVGVGVAYAIYRYVTNPITAIRPSSTNETTTVEIQKGIVPNVNKNRVKPLELKLEEFKKKFK